MQKQDNVRVELCVMFVQRRFIKRNLKTFVTSRMRFHLIWYCKVVFSIVRINTDQFFR